ncbi:MAG TPA: efflux RND transporter permease subunit, partial [bacterium]|nr:efflux RND transporter permease subunit [bacterium]
RLVLWMKAILAKVLGRIIDHPYAVMAVSLLLVLSALAMIPTFGRNFLPAFNEGTATIGVAAGPGIALAASDELGMKIEEAILAVPEVKSTVRRTGRAELDEHAEGVHWHEIDVDFKEEGGRPRQVVLQEIRANILKIGDLAVNLGQPISHRLDHLLSGVRAQLAVKVFGPDLAELRRLGGEIRAAIAEVPGIVDLQSEPLVLVPQLKMAIDRSEAAKKGIGAGALAEDLEMVLNGKTVSHFLEKQRIFEIFMRLNEKSREDFEKIKSLPVKTMPTGDQVSVGQVTNVYPSSGPNIINREDLLRRIVVSANTQGRDLDGTVKEVQSRIEEKVKLPPGYFIKYGGQFESQQKASKMILLLGILSLLGVFLVLYLHFRSVILSLQIMVNVPLALIGSVVAVFLTEKVLSVATLIGFVTLCGIASRNGILLISHYLHLVKEEGEAFSKSMVLRGSLERLVPVSMTALSAILALLPIAFSQGQPGREILHPVAVVIIGGLISSTLLDILVTPAIFYKFGRKAVESWTRSAESESNQIRIGE